MLHHVSFAVDEPRAVATILAGLIGGRVSHFGPWPGGFIAWAPDGFGTAIEVYPQGTEMSPDPGTQARFARNYFAQRHTATHAALSVQRTESQVLEIAAAAGWQAEILDRGGFEVIEMWVENRVMLEVMTPPMTAQYLQVVDAPRITATGRDFRAVAAATTIGTDPATAFAAWTDGDRLRSWWPVPEAHIDLRVGGAFELLFLPENDDGNRGSEGCQILSYVPDRMLSFSWNTPGHLSVGRALTWVVVEFTGVENGERADGGTRVDITHQGIGTGTDWDEVSDYFRHAWRRVLRRMVDRWGSVDGSSASAAVTQPTV